MMFPSSCQCLGFQARQPPRCSASDALGSSQHLLCGAPLTPGSHWHGLAAGELRDCSGCCKLCSAARKRQRLRGAEEEAAAARTSCHAAPKPSGRPMRWRLKQRWPRHPEQQSSVTPVAVLPCRRRALDAPRYRSRALRVAPQRGGSASGALKCGVVVGLQGMCLGTQSW